jgi:hypothetical protein
MSTVTPLKNLCHLPYGLIHLERVHNARKLMDRVIVTLLVYKIVF